MEIHEHIGVAQFQQNLVCKYMLASPGFSMITPAIKMKLQQNQFEIDLKIYYEFLLHSSTDLRALRIQITRICYFSSSIFPSFSIIVEKRIRSELYL